MIGTSLPSLAIFALLAPVALTDARAGGLHRLERLADKLELDDAARAAFQRSIQRSRDQAMVLRKKLRHRRRELRTLLEQQRPSETQVMRQADRIGRLQTQLKKLRLRGMLRLRALLTPEQRSKLRTLRQQERKAIQVACSADIQRLCGQDVGWERRRCLMRQFEQISRECRQALRRRMRRRDHRRQ